MDERDLLFPEEDIYGSEDEQDEDDKPVRVLTQFTIFDPTCRKQFVPLSCLEEIGDVDYQVEAVGYVKPLIENDEDEGQEVDMDDEPERLSFVRLSAVLRYSYDYTAEDEYVRLLPTFPWALIRNT